ncbi:hypothetical protein PHET_09564 [Paragonimus heterotremus]|uniref:Uncharacterized protein n=1 Tax=Paragonimus heterotremus TaxID=100268 RepID=A0A8J4SGW6_9TREM|nr:hypothetical protein PHET_09564 [Paragonimus heterotremus]
MVVSALTMHQFVLAFVAIWLRLSVAKVWHLAVPAVSSHVHVVDRFVLIRVVYVCPLF